MIFLMFYVVVMFCFLLLLISPTGSSFGHQIVWP